MTNRRDELEALSLDALQREARQRGLPPMGRTLSRRQLVELLVSDAVDGIEEPAERDDAKDEKLVPPRLATVTLAGICAAQGLKTEAAELCRAVLAREPQEARANRLLQRLERQAAPPGETEVALWWQGPTVLFAAWQLEPGEGSLDSRAERLAGPGATRVLRLFSAWRDETGVQQQLRDLPVGGLQGQLFLEDVPAGATHRAALGWLGGSGEFLPLCHSPGVSTPAGEPPPEREEPQWVSLPEGARRPVSRAAAEQLSARLRQPGAVEFPWDLAQDDEPRAGWPAGDGDGARPDSAADDLQAVTEKIGLRAGSSWSRSR